MCVYTALPISSELSSWLNKLRIVLNVALPQSSSAPSKWSLICVHYSLTAVGKAQLSGLIPFAVGAAMVFILSLSWALRLTCQRSKHSGSTLARLPSARSLLPRVTHDEGQPLNVAADGTSTAPTSTAGLLREKTRSQRSYGSIQEELDPAAVAVGANPVHDDLRPKYIAAAVNLFLTVTRCTPRCW